MIERRTYFERVSDKLLDNVPRPKKFGMLVDGRFVRGTRSTHRNPWARRWWKVLHLKTMLVDKRA